MSLGAPQLIYLVLALVALGRETAKHGEQSVHEHNFWISALVRASFVGLLYWGGFFG